MNKMIPNEIKSQNMICMLALISFLPQRVSNIVLILPLSVLNTVKTVVKTLRSALQYHHDRKIVGRMQ